MKFIDIYISKKKDLVFVKIERLCISKREWERETMIPTNLKPIRKANF